jgi:MFS family permease
MTDRFRILAGAAALVVLPWVGRRQGLFGPATRSLTARLVRVAGCALVCGLGLALLRVDRHHTINEVLGNGHINWLREAGGLAALSALVTVPFLVLARRPQTDRSSLALVTAGLAVLAFILAPLQVLIIGYVALVLAATGRRSPVIPAALGAGSLAGLLLVPATYGIWWAWPSSAENLYYFLLPIMAVFALTAFPAGQVAAWQVHRTWSPAGEDGKDTRGRNLHDNQIRQGVLAGVTAGAAGGLAITFLFSVIFGELMVLGPLIGAAFGAFGGAYPPRGRPGRSLMAGLFVSRS